MPPLPTSMQDAGDVQVGAARVHWQREGRGPCVVLLHGFPLSGATWAPVVQLLRDRRTCILPDLIGLGRSTSTLDEDYASPGQARAIQGALRALDVDRYVLVGNDTGGWVARELALLEGTRVSHLVLTNTEIPGHRPPWIPVYQAFAAVPGFGAVLRKLIDVPGFLASPLGFGGCFADRGLIGGAFRRDFIAPLAQSPSAIDGITRFLRCMKFSRLDAFRALHAQLGMPTTFIWGADDPTFPESRARTMAQQFPNVAAFHSIPRGKLFFYLEQPQALAALLPADGVSVPS